MRRCSELFTLGWVFLGLVAAQADEPSRFVHVERGDLPIIISAPHGGAMPLPDVSPRDTEDKPSGGAGFVVTRDTGTEELARQLAVSLEQRLGRKPYLVTARAHRRYLDPNRPPDIAYDDPDAKPVYDTFHTTLKNFCRDVQTRFGKGLLLDVHGQGAAKDTVYRGTQDGKTVSLLRDRFGAAAVQGELSLFGRLKSRGWKVHPDPLDGREQAGYRGGYIVQTYGGHNGTGIDAVQLEFGADFRSTTAREQTATTLSAALIEYAADFLDVEAPPEKTASPVTTADRPPLKLSIAVFKGSGASGSREKLLHALAREPQFQVRDATADDIRAGKLTECRVLIHPGGSGSGQGKSLGDEGRQRVREFIANGGGYIGVCAGAYLATCDDDWSLHILDAKVIDRAHWNRGFGTMDIALSPRGREFFSATRDQLPIYYHQGPLLAPADNPDVPDFESLATFTSQIAENGAPLGVMPGTTAIASGTFQKGRVFCFSPHPELTAGQQAMLVPAILWAAQVSR